MDTNVNYTIVGAFVIALIAAVILSIIWLSSGFSIEQDTTYAVYMNEAVTGLNPDSSVEFNGVGVGTVRSIKLNASNPQLVELLINIRKDTPITQGTVATLATRGITGITYIALKDKGLNKKPLLTHPGDPYPIIKTEPSLLLRIDITMNRLSRNFQQISHSLQAVLDKENLESIRQLLINMRRITETMSANNARFDVIMKNTSQASQQFLPLVQSSQAAVNTLQMQTLPMFYEVMANLNSIAQELSAISGEIKRNPAVLIRGTSRPAPGPGEDRK